MRERDSKEEREPDRPIWLSSSDIICCTIGSLNSNNLFTGSECFSSASSESKRQNNTASLTGEDCSRLSTSKQAMLWSKSWLHADFIIITSDLSKAILHEKKLNKIFCLGWFPFQRCQSLSLGATKMQHFKQLTHNCWQSSYLPFEDPVITSHFITQDKVGATESIDYYGLCDAMLIVHTTGGRGMEIMEDEGLFPTITNNQDRASNVWWRHREWENSQARCGDADSLKEREEGDKCRGRRGGSRKCWQRVKVKER